MALATGTVHAEDESRLLIRAKHIYSADGLSGEPGEILVKDGKIAFVGESIELGLPAEIIEVDSVMPGLVNLYSSAGLSGGSSEVSREVTPTFATYPSIDWTARDFLEAIDQGVTTVQVLPATESVFSGLASVVKTAGEEQQRTIVENGSLLVAVCSDPTSGNRSRSRPDSIYVRQPTNRMGVVWIVRSTLHRVANGKLTDAADPKTPVILSEILAGERQVISVSRTDYDIRSALDLGDEFGFKPTIYGGDEAYRIIDELKERKPKIVYTAITTSSSPRGLRGDERTELRWNVLGQLADAEIEFCLAGDDLLEKARFAIRYGLSADTALRSITLGPAEMLGLQDKIGSITVGKDADLVALTGSPEKTTSRVAWTMVDGKVYGNVETQK